MPWFEKLLYAFFPRLRLLSTPWVTIWDIRDRQYVKVASRVTLVLLAVVFILHHYFVDPPLGLATIPRWIAMRFGYAGFAMLMFGVTYLKAYETTNWYRAPLAFSCLVLCFLEAIAITWYSGVPYFYVIIAPFIVSSILRASPARSLVYLAGCYAIAWPFFLQANLNMAYVVSAVVVGVGSTVAFRYGMINDVEHFIAQHEQQETQKKLIETLQELDKENQAWLPSRLYKKMQERVLRDGLNVPQARDEVLRPRLLKVACIFSDIRGFTQQSKDLSGFVINGALPNIQISTNLVEKHSGIPRLVGDLIFSYFDFESPEFNLVAAMRCAFSLVNANEEWNVTATETTRVRRFVLLSFGEAIVGNIGGSQSAREITALGSCVNLLARIDTQTKDKKLAPYLAQNSVIVTSDAAAVAQTCFPDLQMEHIDLVSIGVTIRDFSEEKSLWLVPVHEANRQIVGSIGGARQ